MQLARVTDALATWRIAEQRLATAKPGSADWKAARAAVRQARGAYHEAVAARSQHFPDERWDAAEAISDVA
jgi:hypothetical protein